MSNSETLIFWAMGAGNHYEFWVSPRSKTWGTFFGNSRHNSELLYQISSS